MNLWKVSKHHVSLVPQSQGNTSVVVWVHSIVVTLDNRLDQKRQSLHDKQSYLRWTNSHVLMYTRDKHYCREVTKER